MPVAYRQKIVLCRRHPITDPFYKFLELVDNSFRITSTRLDTQQHAVNAVWTNIGELIPTFDTNLTGWNRH